MKQFAAILFFILIQTGLSSQVVIGGTVRDSSGYGIVRKAEVRLLHTDSIVHTDDGGYFRMLVSGAVDDTLVITHPELGSIRIAMKIEANSSWTNENIRLPGNCRSIQHSDICPKCHSNRQVIPVVYGYPSEKMIRRSEKGEIHLGGCILDDCMPLHYCKDDNLKF